MCLLCCQLNFPVNLSDKNSRKIAKTHTNYSSLLFILPNLNVVLVFIAIRLIFHALFANAAIFIAKDVIGLLPTMIMMNIMMLLILMTIIMLLEIMLKSAYPL